MSAGNAQEIADDITPTEQILLYATRFFWFTSGLNLEMTTDLIMLCKTGKGTRAQLIGRAQRPGRIA
jgi:hypothetical protein